MLLFYGYKKDCDNVDQLISEFINIQFYYFSFHVQIRTANGIHSCTLSTEVYFLTHIKHNLEIPNSFHVSCQLKQKGVKKKKEHKKIRYIPYCLTLFTDLGSWGNKIQYVDFFSNCFKITYSYTISFNQYQYSFMIIANLDDKLFPKHIHFIVNKTIH